MASIISGNESGLLDSSLTILNRNDASRIGTAGHGEQSTTNVSNGNLIVQQQDVYLPSQGEDYLLVRTYNSRGLHNGKSGMEKMGYSAGWSLSTDVKLSRHMHYASDGSTVDTYEVTYGDGSTYEFQYDTAKGLWVSNDGAGAYETLEIIIDTANADPGNYIVSDPGMQDVSVAYVVTRANQSKYTFDPHGRMASIEDTNGVRTEFSYDKNRLIQVRDDQGHVLNYNYYTDGEAYHDGKVSTIVDETGAVLVSYEYDTWGKLTQVTDRQGHVTTYTYNSYGILESVTLPSEQTVDGVTTNYGTRTITYGYEEKVWHGDMNNGSTDRALVLSTITDAEGGITSFEYNFDFTQPDPIQIRGRSGRSFGGRNADRTIEFTGGNTKVINALGNNRAYSNETQYVDWRVANGYYSTYDANTAATDATYQAQVDSIRYANSVNYSYDEDGYLTEVVDQQQYKTTYTYDELNNLTSIVDRNGYASVSSDSSYYRNIRAEQGYVDLAGQGKLAADLTADEKTAILATFTTTLTYDNNGNLLSVNDNQGNLTTYTYSTFNKITSETSAMGNALVNSDDQQYQDKRVELGYAALVANLTAADNAALLSLYTTTYSYDINQNLISRTDPGSDLTQYTYDSFGNLLTQTVYLDATDLVSADKQQVTQFSYDAFGNNIQTIDGEGNTTFSEYDHFGNLTRFIDGNGGITTYTYDNDNRLITITDPEGHVTTNSYDAVGNRTSVVDANGQTVIYVYDKNNMLLATLDPSTTNVADDRSTTFQYDVVGNRTAIIDAEGRETNYVFDARFKLLEIKSALVSDNANGQTRYSSSFAYDGEGNRISQNDNNGNQSQYVYNSNGLLHETTDPTGNVTRFQYDANLNQVQIIVGAQLAELQRRVLKYSYDEEDQLIAEVDAGGNTTRYGYDTAGNRISVVDANSRVSDFIFDKNNRAITEIRPEVTDPVTGLLTRYSVAHRYDANGNEVETIDENGNSTKFTFDKDNQVAMVEDANNIKTVFTYDSRHNRTSVSVGVQANVDINGAIVVTNANDAQITTYKYDEFNQVTSKIDGLGNALISSDDAQYIKMRAELGYVDINGNGQLVANLTDLEKLALTALYTERYSYDKVGNLTQSIDNAGNISSISYDGMNRQTSVADALGNTTTSKYDGNNNQISVTDALGRTTSFSYDGNNRLVDSTDANGIVTHREYDDFGNLRFETTGYATLDTRTTEYRYDLNNRLTDSIDPLGHQTQYNYDAVGNRTSQTTAFGTLEAQTTQYSYDALNRAIQTTDSLGNITQINYDGVGNRVSLIDAKGGLTKFTYDPANRLIQTTDAEGRINSFSYDVRGNRIAVTDGNGNITSFEYDAKNNLRAVVDAEGNRSESNYDTVYNRVSTTDGNGNTTNYAFDALNRQIVVTDALGNITNYAFDAVGNRLSITDALNRTRTFVYDALNRITTETAADGTQTTYAYDAISNRTSITNAANTIQAATSTFAYNKDNQLVSQTDALGNITSYAYDSNHNLLTVTDSNGGVISNTYDNKNQLITSTDALGHVTTFSYDENGNQVQVTDANGNTSTTYYNANNEVTISVDSLGYASTYQYDNNGNVTSRTLYMTALVGAQDATIAPALVASASDQTVTYEYNQLNRQVASVDAEGYRTTTSYDAVGNALTRTDANGNITNFAYDVVNRLATTTDAKGGVTSNVYDVVGNRTSRTDANGNTTNYIFDTVNRLVTTTDALGNVTSNTYDSVGNRISTINANNQTTVYAYDLNNRLLKQTDALGVETNYSYDGVGNRLMMTTAANTAIAATTSYVYDADNNMSSMTDALGNVTSYSYDANNNRLSLTDANGQITNYVYDNNNRLITKTDPGNNSVSYVYDGSGNQVQFTDANGNVTTSYYNAKNENLVSVDASGYATSNVFDGNGNIVSQTLSMTALALPVDPAVIPTLTAAANDQTVSFEYDALNRTAARIDAEGYRTEFTYDATGNQTQSRQQITADGLTYAVSNTYYDGVNRVIHSISAEGYLTSYTYDAAGNRTASTVFNEKVTPPVSGNPSPVTGDSGRTTTFSYDAENRLSTQTSALGIVTAYGYDERGNRLSVTDAQGSSDERTTTFSYDNINRLIDTTNANGVISRNVYDNVGNVTERYDAYGSIEQRITSFVYDNNNRVISSTNAIGVTTSYTFDANGNNLTTTLATGVVGTERTLSNEYDANNRLIAEVNGAGERTEYVYDGAGNRTETIQAPGVTGKERRNFFEFNKDNQVTATVDALGVRTSYSYDGAGNKIVTVQAVGLSEQRSSLYSYNLDNQLIQVTDPEAGITSYVYDALGNQVQVTDANGGVQVNTFDALGQSATSLSAGGILSSSVYDNRGNLIAFTQSLADGTQAQTITYSYDAIDQQVSITDGEGFTTTISYDSFGNQTNVINGQYLVDALDPSYDAIKAAKSTAVTSSFTYDADGRMTSMVDGEGNSTTYTYDEVGNRLTLTKAANDATLSLTTSYQYDLANRLTQTVTPEGGIVNQTYDALGNKTGETLLQGYDQLGAEVWITKSFEYNATGKMTAEIDGEGVRIEHTFDAMGNMLTHRYAAGTPAEQLVRMEYDLNNRMTAEIDGEGNRTDFAYDSMGNRIKVTDSLGRVAHFYFDGSNKLVTSLDPEGYINAFTYDASGNQTEVKVYMTRYTGTVNDLTVPVPTASIADRSTTYVYNDANQMVLEIDTEGNQTQYEYDGAGNKTKETQFANSSAPRTLAYIYDASSRLVQFTDVDGTVTTFTYDAANNKISESIFNAIDPNTTRTTVFTYDLNNRETSSVFDPSGLALTQTQTFDKLGNVITSTDKNGTVTSYSYDANNRMLSYTVDPSGLSLTTSYTYDEVGNRISLTDARGNTTNYLYDNNNRLIEEKLPAINTYSISDLLLTGVRPTQTYSYDAAGNQTQVIDANGNAATTYYDSNNRVIAELDSLNTLREYSYNAAGERVTETVYMTQLTSAEQNVATRPIAPAGETRIYTMEYDKAGRLTRKIYPETSITTLSNTGTDTPTTTTVSKTVDVRYTYDTFGNKVEVFDLNGNRSLSYYDADGQQIAVVDAEGYMIEWKYDEQGNVLEQRTYTTKLDVSLLTPSAYPVTPTGEVYIISRSYDAAGNMLTETSPSIATYNPLDPAAPLPQQQVITNTYDANGNVTSTTIAAGTTSQTTEYSYYDASNRLIAVINAERVLHQYSYDANNNKTSQIRYLDAIAATVDLSTLTASSDFLSLVSVDTNGDQTTVFAFDAINRLTSQTDLMGAGTADDVTEIYKYDATTLRTYSQNAEGYFSQNEFNAKGDVVRTISADGSGTIFTYDAVGNRILAYTGQVDNLTTAANTVTVTVGDKLNINWNLDNNVSMGSRVVYGLSSQASVNGYTSQTGFIGSWGQTSASANIDLASFNAGDSVYFRVVTQDSAGNTSWTEEKMITIPPRVTNVSISQPATDSLDINARFDAGTVNPVLLYGAPQNPTTPVNFVLQADGSYTASLSGLTNAEDLVFKLQWQDSTGQTYNSAEQAFEAAGNHVAVITTAGEGTLSGGGYEILTNTKVPSSLGSELTVVTAKWRPAGSTTGYFATANSGVLDTNGAFYSYDLTLNQTTPMVAGDYEIIISGAKANGDEVVLDTFNYTVGSTTPVTLTSQSVSWQAASVGNSQVVIVDGVRVDSSLQSGYASFDVNIATAGSQNYQVYYTNQFTATHTTDLTNTAISHNVNVNSTEDTSTTPSTFSLDVAANFSAAEVAQMNGGVTLSYRAAGSTDVYTNVLLTQLGNDFTTALTGLAAGQYELQLSYTDINAVTVIASTTIADTAVATNSTTYTTGYNLNISSVLSATEVANISGDVTLYYRGATTGLDFVNSKVMSLDAATNTLTASLDNIQAGQYDIKLAYTDVNGDTVIIDWNRADTSVANTSITANSEILTGTEEQNGIVTLGTNGVISVNPGLFVGDLSATSLFNQLNLNPVNTGLLGDTQNTNGQSTGYFAESTFNALDGMISEVGRDGLYREYAVDGNGNSVASYLFGDKTATSSIASFIAYDARNRSIAEFGAAFIPEGETVALHPTTRYAYDVNDNIIEQIDARGFSTTTQYNALGSKTQTTDENGGITTYQYDVRGNEVAVTDASGNTARKEYDAFGRLTADINGAGDYMRYSYDALGRKTSMTKGLDAATAIAQGNTTTYTFDQRDNMTTKTDALGGISRYSYDKLDQQTWAYDSRYDPADSTTFTFKYGQEFDALGRVIAGISFQNGLEAREIITYDVYGNRIAETDAEGRVKTTMYGAASRITETVDEGGNRILKTYDQYGQLVREYDPDGTKDIVRSYDLNGNLISITDNSTNVSTTYGYDIAGNKISEVLTTPMDAQGEATHNRNYTYTYDSRGNLARWSDSVTGMMLNYWYDESGNLQRVYTDAGYDPDNQNTASDPAFQQVDHWYYYDSANRLNAITTGENGEIISNYTYDNAGNRSSWNNQGTTVSYEFDANGRVTKGTWFSGTGTSQVENTQLWQYDKVGNVVDYRTYKDGVEDTYSTYQYFENNKQWFSDVDGSQTTNTFDKSGRQTTMKLVDGGSTYNYSYSYYADGREKAVTANGDAKGSSSFSYDANENKVRVDKGNGDGQDRNQYSTFMYNNENQIVYKWADDGESANREKVEYAYANGNPVGETGTDMDGVQSTKLDTGNYSTVKNFGDEFPNTSVTLYTVNQGDTLQSIASSMYGNPSLWFVIAEANGLNGTEELKAGSKLQVPNTIQNGSLTGEAHATYKEGDIIGSSLPNLVSPPPPSSGGCGSILMIIIVVVIAVVAYYFLGPAANGIASSLFGAAAATGAAVSVGVTLASYAIAGALVYAAANIVQQGLFIALGFQDSFEWGQVGDAAITGLFTGAAAGVATLGTAANTASQVAKISESTARISASALKVAGSAIGQYLKDGEITSWTSIAVAALGSTKASDGSTLGGFGSDFDVLASGSSLLPDTTLNYVSPWLQLAETYVRNDGELKPADWATAVTGTITNAINSNAAKDNQLGYRLLTNTIVAGALSQYDKTAAESYYANAVGNEIGQLIGGAIVSELSAARVGQDWGKRNSGSNGTAGASGSVGVGSDVPTGSNVGATTTQQAPTSVAIDNDKNGSLWSIAANQLPSDASDADILAYTQQLMQVNPGLDPRALSAGTSLTLPTGSEMISADTLAAYTKSDAEYQTYLDDQAFAAVDKDFARTNSNGNYSKGIGGSTGTASSELQQQILAAAEAGDYKTVLSLVDQNTSSVERVLSGSTQESSILADGRESKTQYWQSAQDNAVKEGSFLKYLGADVMNTLGDLGYNLAEMAVGIYNNPEGGIVGAGKSIVNFGPEAFNGATNLAKTSLNGLTQLTELSGIAPEGTFAGFRETDALNFTPAFAYNNKAEEGGSLLANLASGAAITKFGGARLGTRVSDKSVVDGLIELDPKTIRTTQTTTKQQGATLQALTESMQKKGFVVESDRIIDVVRMPDGGLTSLDNTRIIAADLADVKIQARVSNFDDVLPDDKQFISRFIGRKGEVPKTFGDAVQNRISNQKPAFRNNYPLGSPFISYGKNY